MRTTLIALVAAAGLTLAGCGGSAKTEHNAADVAFATQMIPHHAQALDMVAMTKGHDLDPDVRTIVAAIDRAQTPEITEMKGFLKDWDQKVPSTDGMQSDGAMTGMMSADQMDQLAKTADPAFQKLWLTLMVQHHQGAVDMARTEIEKGENADALKLARSILTGQTKEIATMGDLAR